MAAERQARHDPWLKGTQALLAKPGKKPKVDAKGLCKLVVDRCRVFDVYGRPDPSDPHCFTVQYAVRNAESAAPDEVRSLFQRFASANGLSFPKEQESGYVTGSAEDPRSGLRYPDDDEAGDVLEWRSTRDLATAVWRRPG